MNQRNITIGFQDDEIHFDGNDDSLIVSADRRHSKVGYRVIHSMKLLATFWMRMSHKTIRLVERLSKCILDRESLISLLLHPLTQAGARTGKSKLKKENTQMFSRLILRLCSYLPQDIGDSLWMMICHPKSHSANLVD
jgi:hypothetical protein